MVGVDRNLKKGTRKKVVQLHESNSIERTALFARHFDCDISNARGKNDRKIGRLPDIFLDLDGGIVIENTFELIPLSEDQESIDHLQLIFELPAGMNLLKLQNKNKKRRIRK